MACLACWRLAVAINLSCFHAVFPPAPVRVQLLAVMVTRSLERPGCGWRCGVRPPVDEADLHGLGAMAAVVMAQRTRGALMQLEVVTKEPE